MKTLLTLFLAFILLLQSFSSLLIIAGYEANKQYITQKFCVNKSKPKLHCNGKCHLRKQLKEEQKREQSTGTTSKEKQETVLICEQKWDVRFASYSTLSEAATPYLVPQFPEVSFSIFHPPSC